MNYSQYKEAEKSKVKGIHYWANKCRKIQKTLEYNHNPKATVRHHLRDTEEQRKYNDEHYEYWGFNQDGTFEYGKYVIFITIEEHAKIHKHSEETRQKISINTKMAMAQDDIRQRCLETHRGFIHSDEQNIKISNSLKEYYSKNTCAWKGKTHTEESKEKMSKAQIERYKNLPVTDETKKKIGDANRGERNGMYGKHLSDKHKQAIHDKLSGRKQSDEARKNSRDAIREMSIKYFEYKSNGGTLGWNEFKHFLKEQKKNVKSEDW